MIQFITGAMTVLLCYALFSSPEEEELEEELVINGLSTKLIEMSCQTCRKLKKHREVEKGVYECTKCHRRVYTR